MLALDRVVPHHIFPTGKERKSHAKAHCVLSRIHQHFDRDFDLGQDCPSVRCGRSRLDRISDSDRIGCRRADDTVRSGPVLVLAGSRHRARDLRLQESQRQDDGSSDARPETRACPSLGSGRLPGRPEQAPRLVEVRRSGRPSRLKSSCRGPVTTNEHSSQEQSNDSVRRAVFVLKNPNIAPYSQQKHFSYIYQI